MTVSLRQWLNSVRGAVLDVPDVMALDYLSQTANEFAERTLALKRTLRYDLEAGVSDYFVRPDDMKGVVPVALQSVHVNGTLYTPPSPLSCTNACYVPCAGGAVVYEAATGMVDVSPRPTEDSPGGLRITLAVAPRVGEHEVDSLLWDQFMQPILAGAVAKLYSLPGHPWSSPSSADRHMVAYGAGISAARYRALAGYTLSTARLDPGVVI